MEKLKWLLGKANTWLINIKVGFGLLITLQCVTLCHILYQTDLDYDNLQNVFILACFFMTVFSSVFGFFGLCAIIMVIGLKNSTHEIEYVPIDSDDLKREKETNWKKLEDEMGKPYKDLLEDDNFPEDTTEDEL